MKKTRYHHGDLKNALIQAGSEILAEDGIGSLSLRKVASRVGVSHSAPYAHFVDKQDLIAAISTEGFRMLNERFLAVGEHFQGNPDQFLIELAYAYLQFATERPAYFKLMFSGVLEKEKEYPEFVEVSKQNLNFLIHLVEQCQSAGLLKSGPAEVLAVSVWSLVHGFVDLYMERQMPSTVLDHEGVQNLLCIVLNQITLREIRLVPNI
jgi:AcrR family transcriptional regulator